MSPDSSVDARAACARRVSAPTTQTIAIANPTGRRVALFQAALERLGLPPAEVVPYADLLAGRIVLPQVVRPGARVRIESPERDFAVERALLAAGAASAAEERYLRLDESQVRGLEFDKGRVHASRQWYLGFCAALARIEAQLAACPPHCLMNHPREIAVMFDKPACHARLAAAGVRIPPALGEVAGYDELIAAMKRAGCWRVFVKLAHGAGASGVVAYRRHGDRHEARTTVELARRAEGVVLYNTRRVRRLRDRWEIAELVDALCRHRVHVEAWIPKAGIDSRAFDLRVVTIAGRARHTVARLSREPMTNLHLLNERRDPEAVRSRMRPAVWGVAMADCERAAACFPRSLYTGVDLLIAAGFRSHAVLEVNAFGDLLPGALDGGDDTYTAELRAVLAAEALPEVP